MTSTTLSPTEFEQALRRACVRSVTHYMHADPLRGGDRVAVQYGALIREVADEADLSVHQARRQLRALHEAGKVIRDDRRGGSTAWWLVGLADELRPAAAAATAPPPSTPRQTVTPATVPGRQHWSDVLGVARDCSTRDATRAYRLELARLLESDDLEAPNDLKRLKEAYSACCREHDIQIEDQA